MLIGLISDTHGRLRPEVFRHFEGVDRILHAGDIGDLEILVELEALAPVTAVWGNTDGFDVRARVPEFAWLELEGSRLLVLHGHQLGSPEPARLRAAHPDAGIIVYGHTHKALVDEADGRLVVNPGAAGPARFGVRPSVALLTLTPSAATVRLVEL
ncbi:MAG TPA: metallophosphoesterase family protein [Longimicrobiales bacterium]